MNPQNLSWTMTLPSQNRDERFHLSLLNNETLAILLPDLPGTPQMISEMRRGKTARVQIAHRAEHTLTADGDRVEVVFEDGTDSPWCFKCVIGDFFDRKLP